MSVMLIIMLILLLILIKLIYYVCQNDIKELKEEQIVLKETIKNLKYLFELNSKEIEKLKSKIYKDL